VAEGEVEAEIAGTTPAATEADVFAAPAHAPVQLANRSAPRPAFPFRIDDAPLQRRIGIDERFAA
jgi:gentisate 1,2-dioxygenase